LFTAALCRSCLSQTIYTEDARCEALELLGDDVPAGRRVAGAAAFCKLCQERLSELVERWDQRSAPSRRSRVRTGSQPRDW